MDKVVKFGCKYCDHLRTSKVHKNIRCGRMVFCELTNTIIPNSLVMAIINGATLINCPIKDGN